MYVLGYCSYRNSDVTDLLDELKIKYDLGECQGEVCLDSFEIPDEYDDLFEYLRGNAVMPSILYLSDTGKKVLNKIEDKKRFNSIRKMNEKEFLNFLKDELENIINIADHGSRMESKLYNFKHYIEMYTYEEK